jgi:hypothetical protein
MAIKSDLRGPGIGSVSLSVRTAARFAVAGLAAWLVAGPARADEADRPHTRALLENALRYAAPANKLVDPSSGYPVEGWNHDPKQGLYLRSFTQLTAIGEWMELLANLVAGTAETPGLSREQALANLKQLVASLLEDQKNPDLAAKGLLGNFLDLATGKRLGPLASEVEKSKIVDAFGPEKGEVLWKALIAKKWLVPRNHDREAEIHRDGGFGHEYFDGPLLPHADVATRQKLMAVLDRRVVMLIFGDNSNLSASAAKTIGALLLPSVRDRPEIAAIRRDLEEFLENQQPGYSHLYDAEAGLFDFGWDASRNRLFGWEDPQGRWTVGRVDYLVNEFRGPATFVAVRFGLPVDAIKNLGFKIKPYRMQDGRDLYTLAPWEGSAFQALGLSLFLQELKSPSWRTILENAVAIELDYSTRHQLPGFLSESYTGQGSQYTGTVGIPEITVSPRPRITDAASLYTLGVADTIAPGKMEEFLKMNWPVVSRLATDHGMWEGYNVTQHEVIPFQTSAHSLSLILGLLGTSSDHMQRYLDSKGLGDRLAAVFQPGEATVDLLAGDARAVAWTDKEDKLSSSHDQGAFHIQSDQVKELGIAFIARRPEGVNLSGGWLGLRYRSAQALEPVTIELKRAGPAPAAGLISNEISTRLVATGGRDAEVRIPLPATPGLAQIKEVVITYRTETKHPLDLAITGASVIMAK